MLALAEEQNFEKSYTDNAIIAALFHDTGMIDTLGPEHGINSMRICENFLDHSTDLETAVFEQAFTAIVNHDKKEYKEKNTQTRDLSTLLPIADDLDAFGRIGVLRYYEIYYLRGIPEKEIPLKVLQNIQKRWEHFSFHFKTRKQIEQFHRKRFLESYRYFEKLDRAYQQADSKEENPAVELSYLLKESFTGQSESIQQFLRLELQQKNKHSKEVWNFLYELQKEVEAFKTI